MNCLHAFKVFRTAPERDHLWRSYQRCLGIWSHLTFDGFMWKYDAINWLQSAGKDPDSPHEFSVFSAREVLCTNSCTSHTLLLQVWPELCGVETSEKKGSLFLALCHTDSWKILHSGNCGKKNIRSICATYFTIKNDAMHMLVISQHTCSTYTIAFAPVQSFKLFSMHDI